MLVQPGVPAHQLVNKDQIPHKPVCKLLNQPHTVLLAFLAYLCIQRPLPSVH